MLRNGEEAPVFTLVGHDRENYALTDFKDRPLLLLFFRGKFCPTSKRYLIQWQEFHRKIHNLGARILAISYDSVETHTEMAERYDIRFPILSDPDLAVSRAYGVYINRHEDEFDHGEPGIVIIDKEGRVAYSQLSSGPKGLGNPGDIAPILIYMFAHGGEY